MNWDDLSKVISKMTEAERSQDVRFIEPYDDGDGYDVQVSRAECDKVIPDQRNDPEFDEYRDDPFVKKGEYYLW